MCYPFVILLLARCFEIVDDILEQLVKHSILAVKAEVATNVHLGYGLIFEFLEHGM